MNKKQYHQPSLPLGEPEQGHSETTKVEAPAVASKNEQESDDYKDDKFSKYIVYVDESGDHSLQSIDPQYPIFVLAFCVFHKRHYSEQVVSALEKFKFKHFGHDQIVLHENEIRRQKPPFNIFNGRDHYLEFMADLTQIIERSKFILVTTTIDKRELSKTDAEGNAYHIALAHCMETLHEFLSEKGEQNKPTHIVVECRGDKEDKELELEFRRICDGANPMGRTLPYEVIFADKKVMSTGLQLADLVARPIGIKTLRPEQDNRAFEVLTKKFYCEGGRDNVGYGFFGKGMKVFPAPKSEKPR